MNARLPFSIALVFSVAIGSTSLALAQDRFVDAVGGSDLAGDGSLASPWRTLTNSLGQMSSGPGRLHVLPGTYDEALGEAFPIALRPNVDVLGTDAATTIVRSTATGPTIAGSLLSLTQPVEAVTASISGLTLTRSTLANQDGILIDATVPVDVAIVDSVFEGLRRGIMLSLQRGTPVIRACIVRNNWEGGIQISGNAAIGSGELTPLLRDNVYLANGGTGLRLTAQNDSEIRPTVSHDELRSNRRGIDVEAGIDTGLSCRTGLVVGTFDANVFFDNEVGLRLLPAAESDIRATVSNSLFARNGEGIYAEGVDFDCGRARAFTLLVNDTIVDSRSFGVTPFHRAGNGRMTITNCILHGNADDLHLALSDALVDVVATDVGDGDFVGTNSNISVDPDFVNRAGGDYRLRPTSPCIDAGTSTPPVGTTLLGFDLVRSPRDVDGDHDGTRQVDMGAIEFSPPATGCRYGTVDSQIGFVSDVVFVNGSAGDAFRNVQPTAGTPLRIDVSASQGGPATAPFALFAFRGIPDGSTVSMQPASLGNMCFPTPLTGGGAPGVVTLFNNIPSSLAQMRLGTGRLASSAAPFSAAISPSRVRSGLRFTLQGLVANGASTQGRFAISNAVVVVVP